MVRLNSKFERLFSEFEKQAEVPEMKVVEFGLYLPVPCKFLTFAKSKTNKKVCVPNSVAARFILQRNLRKCPATLVDLQKLVSSSPQL